jgi:hypothetical protein
MPSTSYYFKPSNTRTFKKNNINKTRKNGNSNKNKTMASIVSKSFYHSNPSNRKMGFTQEGVTYNARNNKTNKRRFAPFNYNKNMNKSIIKTILR